MHIKSIQPAVESIEALDSFVAWFGASAAVDKRGNPLRVYHGTSESFAKFSPEKIRGESCNEFGAGFYFTPSPGVAMLHASARQPMGRERKPPVVMAAYLSIKNPLFVCAYDRGLNGWHGQHDGVIVVYPDSDDPRDPANWAEIVVASDRQIRILSEEPVMATTDAVSYPLASRDKWYGEGTYKQDGGRLVSVSPAQYLAAVRPLTIDDESRENIDLLKEHIRTGGTLDPLLIRAGGVEDGRHRAHAALELGIGQVPVIAYGQHFVHAPEFPESVVHETPRPRE